jgi:cyanophycinase-like exopeptidase
VTVRLLTIMGSGETAPTMVKVHRGVVERLGDAPARGLLLDTPFGFQTNAPEIATRAVDYFRDSVGAELEIAGLRSAADLRGPRGDQIVAALAAAPFVFAGPGSPTYALRQWRDTLVPPMLAEKLALGGAVTFASAAALTLGVASVPVYEIYKVGEDPRWVDGLDLLAPLGLPVVVIPHYDNAEGGTHDTRFCYLGEDRLAALEAELAPGTFVLGVDEHTALSVDLDAGTATVVGHGVVTVRARGRSATIESGETVPIARLVEMAGDLAAGRAGATGAPAAVVDESVAEPVTASPAPAAPAAPAAPTGSPLLQAIRWHEEAFRSAREANDADAMVDSVLGLEEEMWAWRADTLQSDEMDRGRAALRAMINDLGQVALAGTRDPAEVVGPYVELALTLREAARGEKRFAEADAVRDRLVALGVEIHDTPEGSTWGLGEPRT